MTSPTAPFTQALGDLRTLLAGLAAYRTYTGTADQAAAEATIYLFSADGPPDPPLSIVTWGTTWSQELETLSLSGAGDWSIEGSLIWYTRWPKPDGASDDAAITFGNHLGAILTELAALGASPGRIIPTGIRLADGPRLTSPRESESFGEFFEAAFAIDFAEGRT